MRDPSRRLLRRARAQRVRPGHEEVPRAQDAGEGVYERRAADWGGVQFSLCLDSVRAIRLGLTPPSTPSKSSSEDCFRRAISGTFVGRRCT